MSQNNIAIVTRCASFADLVTKEALDLAMIFGTFEQAVSVYFIEDGVFQLLANQQGAKLNCKDYTAVIAALPFYDVDKLYYSTCDASTRKVNITSEAIIGLSNGQIAEELRHYKHVFNFA